MFWRETWNMKLENKNVTSNSRLYDRFHTFRSKALSKSRILKGKNDTEKLHCIFPTSFKILGVNQSNYRCKPMGKTENIGCHSRRWHQYRIAQLFTVTLYTPVIILLVTWFMVLFLYHIIGQEKLIWSSHIICCQLQAVICSIFWNCYHNVYY